MELAGKNVLVVGLARSGVAAVRLLASHGARVVANDARAETQLGDAVEKIRPLSAELVTGSHPEGLFTGAELIVVSPGVPFDLAALESARRAGVPIISEVELAVGFLRGKLIGVTGSNGKTTTTALIGELMSTAGEEVLVGGNIGQPLSGLAELSSERTWTVAEFSSFQLETIDRLHVDVAVVTNLTPDHLDRHKTFDAYVRAKHRIFLNQAPSDFAVLNGRDPAVARMVAELGLPSRAVYFSSAGERTVSGHRADLFVSDDRINAFLSDGDERVTPIMALSDVPLRGMHNVENVMAALGACLCALDATTPRLPALTEAVRNFKGVEHRLEFVAKIDGVEFYNDSKATNVDSTIKALEAFDGKVILILGGKDKGGDFTVLAPLVREKVRLIVLIGAASDKIEAQLRGTAPMIRATSIDAAAAESFAEATAGESVLLAPACASFDMFEDYQHRGRAFKEAVGRLSERRVVAGG
jgi:UDP-N-acetylmuramoylalanine--D-glutamate ligase